MILFFIYTVCFLASAGCFAKLLKYATQKGQLFGKWQDILIRLDEGGYTWAAKPLGLCDMCFSHLMAVLFFVVYVFFVLSYAHWPFGVFGSIVWYLFFVPVSSVINLLLIRI